MNKQENKYVRWFFKKNGQISGMIKKEYTSKQQSNK